MKVDQSLKSIKIFLIMFENKIVFVMKSCSMTHIFRSNYDYHNQQHSGEIRWKLVVKLGRYSFENCKNVYSKLATDAIYIFTTTVQNNTQTPPPLSRLGTGSTTLATEVSRRSYLRMEHTASKHQILDLSHKNDNYVPCFYIPRSSVLEIRWVSSYRPRSSVL